jgi:hypothetical protein
MQRLQRLSGGLLLALLAAVLLWRGIRLAAAGGGALDGRDERAWFAWAVRDAEIGSTYGRIRPRLAPGEPLVLVVPPQQSALWLGVMALYYLPEQKVAAVRMASEPVDLPDSATVVRFSPAGTATVERPGGEGR